MRPTGKLAIIMMAITTMQFSSCAMHRHPRHRHRHHPHRHLVIVAEQQTMPHP